MARWRYFTEAEVEGLQPEFVDRLDNARLFSGVPYIITSGLRTAEQNQKADGVSDSSHLRGLAVDLSAPDSRTRFLMVHGLLAAGFRRIGIYDKHIHADVDETLDQDVAWVGISH